MRRSREAPHLDDPRAFQLHPCNREYRFLTPAFRGNQPQRTAGAARFTRRSLSLHEVPRIRFAYSASMSQTAPARKQVLLIGGSLNQTTMMHRIGERLGATCDCTYSPFYCDQPLRSLQKAGLLEFTIFGGPMRRATEEYLRAHALPVDEGGVLRDYDLALTCSDLVLPKNIRNRPLVLVQEGMTDPERFWYWVRKALPFMPLWSCGTSGTGLSGLYDRFCVASQGYKDFFVRNGIEARKIAVTGIPNFDDCRLRGTTSRTTTTCWLHVRHARDAQVRRPTASSQGRGDRRRPSLVFKLHPNEKSARTTEISRSRPEPRCTQGPRRGDGRELDGGRHPVVVARLRGAGARQGVHSYSDLRGAAEPCPLQGGTSAGTSRRLRDLASRPGRRDEASPRERVVSFRRARARRAARQGAAAALGPPGAPRMLERVAPARSSTRSSSPRRSCRRTTPIRSAGGRAGGFVCLRGHPTDLLDRHLGPPRRQRTSW